MENEAILLQVRDGDLVGVSEWVYVWLRPGADRPVVYVGSTAVPAVVRIWLHLHDTDPEVGRMKARYPDIARDPLDVLAFPVPSRLDRAAVKSALVERLETRGLLSERYVGDQPALLTGNGAVTPAVERMVAEVIAHNGAAG
ncbi:hypothetical protein E1212_05525 [Jiangella ureilytica]|uniref:GIY-YIG nuclease family protein n=1 Tax=Jiangella ureilytica TaxID=2530374 RepID=A0A4R4RU73_9ACTN|nr:hypothetical protein [Jiangella ureilytica]TDC53627.1 hypothetical protein E1212_05525 [Jiangella ureilytica]